jgi:hypothetical protein
MLAFFAGPVSLEPDASLRIILKLVKPFEGVSAIPDATSGELHAFRTVAKCVGAHSAGVVTVRWWAGDEEDCVRDETMYTLVSTSFFERGREDDRSWHQTCVTPLYISSIRVSPDSTCRRTTPELSSVSLILLRSRVRPRCSVGLSCLRSTFNLTLSLCFLPLCPRFISAVISFLAPSRLSLVAPASITQILDSIAPFFAETMKAFVPGKDSVKQHYDQHAGMQRSVLRTIFSLSKLSSVGARLAFEQVVIATRRGEFSRDWNELDH